MLIFASEAEIGKLDRWCVWVLWRSMHCLSVSIAICKGNKLTLYWYRLNYCWVGAEVITVEVFHWNEMKLEIDNYFERRIHYFERRIKN